MPPSGRLCGVQSAQSQDKQESMHVVKDHIRSEGHNLGGGKFIFAN
jgi:hypothetical protein